MGTNYSGWQRQTTAISVQQVIEEALNKLFEQSLHIVGCGRTDSGVHAKQYYFHTVINNLPDYDLLWRLNKMLPDDIAIHEIIPVADKASSRYDAISRQYTYYFHTSKNAILAAGSVLIDAETLDLQRMQKALTMLTHNTDYSAFCKTPDRHNTCTCHIDIAKIERIKELDQYKITIRGNRFLRAMIRIITHRIILVGMGKLDLKEFERYFTEGNKGEQIVLMPPQGLYLDHIEYPNI